MEGRSPEGHAFVVGQSCGLFCGNKPTGTPERLKEPVRCAVVLLLLLHEKIPLTQVIPAQGGYIMQTSRTHCTFGARVLVFSLIRKGGRWALPRPGRGVTPLHPADMGMCLNQRFYSIPNSRSPFSRVTRASSSTSIPRLSARNCAIVLTLMGSLRLPRKGTGAI